MQNMVDGSTKEAHRSMLGLYTVQMRSGIRISFPVKLRESVNSSHPLGFPVSAIPHISYDYVR